MMTGGTVAPSGDWLELQSLARSIENEMAAAGLIDAAEETPEASLQRRQTYAAMARGIVAYLKSQMEVVVDAGALRNTGETNARIPASQKQFTVSGGSITIPAGGVRAESETGVRVPLSQKALVGKVR